MSTQPEYFRVWLSMMAALGQACWELHDEHVCQESIPSLYSLLYMQGELQIATIFPGKACLESSTVWSHFGTAQQLCYHCNLSLLLLSPRTKSPHVPERKWYPQESQVINLTNLYKIWKYIPSLHLHSWMYPLKELYWLDCIACCFFQPAQSVGYFWEVITSLYQFMGRLQRHKDT